MGAPLPVSACAVCFGDPDSTMAKGAAMGVAVMVGVVGVVLVGILATGLSWLYRSRQLVHRHGNAFAGVAAAVP
jgi:hypothetical protein